MSPRTRRSHRPPRAVALAAGAVALAAASSAQAAITVTAQGPGGAAIVGESVTLLGADGTYVTSGVTDAAGAVILNIRTSAPTGPYSAMMELYGSSSCGGATRETPTQGGIADGASVTLVSALPLLCPASAASDQPAATGMFDAPTQSILATAGGTVDLNVRAPYSATGLTISAGGVVIGGPVDSGTVRITAPAGGYTGPLTVSYAYKGAPASYTAGTMTSRPVGATPPVPGPIDIEAIVDVSGSMSINDPQFIRKDAMSLLVDLMRRGDTLGAVGFDDTSKAIFGPTNITGTVANANALKGAARRGIVNRGSTDYNIGMNDAYAALTTTPGVDPNRQKAIVFLTDGGHNSGDYLNGHLRFAMNGSGRAWPVCAVQLGAPKSFQAKDVALLKRIATETGGKYFATASAGSLSDIYASCFNLVAAQRTLVQKTFTFTPRSGRTLAKKVPKGLKQSTFFATWRAGTYQLTLTDPKGRRYTAKKPGKGVAYRRGATFAFYRVNRPAAGTWKVQLKNVRMTAPKGQGKISVTTPK